MKRFHRVMILLMTAVVLGACNRPPELDAKDAQTLKASAETIRNSLEPAQKLQFDNAITMIVVSTLDPMQTLDLASRGTLPSQAGVIARLRPVVDGLDANAVITLGKQSASEVRTRLAGWEAQHAALQKRYEAYEASAKQATKLKPIAADLRTVNSVSPLFGDNQVEVDVTLENGLDEPVTEVRFDLGLMPQGVAKPWVVQPFSRKLKTPIPPGGKAVVTVGPIAVNIPEVYKGPVQLEADIEIKAIGRNGAKALEVPKWDEVNAIFLAKLESSIAEVKEVLRRLEGQGA